MSSFPRKVIDYLRNTPPGVLARREYWRHRGARERKKYSDYECICRMYKSRTGREIHLAEPKRFYEKLNWLKLFWRIDLQSQCADKYTVREYVESKGHPELLNDLLAAYKTPEELIENLDNLPSRFVVKASHGSGWNLIVKDKKKVPWFWWKRIMRSWMKQNAAWFGREWSYETDDPRLVVEKYLEDETGQLRDFKVFCFHGKPEFVMIEEDRYSDHKRLFFDTDCQLLEMNDGFGFGETVAYEKTEHWDEMLTYAAELAEPFPFVRVDFYCCNSKVYFGEMTFFNDGGFASFTPDEWDFRWGEKLCLPEANYNKQLLKQLR